MAEKDKNNQNIIYEEDWSDRWEPYAAGIGLAGDAVGLGTAATGVGIPVGAAIAGFANIPNLIIDGYQTARDTWRSFKDNGNSLKSAAWTGGEFILDAAGLKALQYINKEGRHKDKSRHHHTDAKEEGHQDQQGKQAVRPFRLLFPQCLCNQRAAAYAEHIPDGTQDVQRRHNHTDGREFRLAHKPGDKESVHNNIQGQEYVHHDGGQRKTQQFTVIKTF